MGNRINFVATFGGAKHVYNNQTLMLEKSTYYILDAQGNQLSMYEHLVDDAEVNYYLTERNIYGSSRLGTLKDPINMMNAAPLPSYGILGNRNYELSNHLGNVLMVINDIIYPLSADNTTIDSYEVGISNIFDYSPFGAPLDGRTIQNEMYSLIEKCYDSIALDTAYLIDCDFQNGGCGWTSKNCPQALNCNYSTGVCKLILFKCSRIGKFPPYIKTPQDNEVTHNYTKTSGTTYFYEFEFDFGLGSCGSIDSVIFFEGGNFDYIQHITSSGHYSGNFTVTGSGSSKVGFYLAGGGDCQSTIDNFKLYTIDTLGVVENCTSNLVVEIGGYRYGFNGQERDNEVSGEGNSYTAEFWQYDPRSGRRWNIDPKPNPAISPYATFSNNPIFNSDPYGDTIVNKEVTDKVIKQIDVIINKAENTIAENKMKLDELKRRGSLSNEEKEKVNTLINENSIANTIVMNLNKLKENISDLDKDENLYEFKRINNLNPATLKPDLIELNETAQKLSDGRLHITIPYVNTEFLSSTIHGIKHGAQIVSGFLVPYFENGSNYTERFEGNHTAAELEAYKTQYLAVPNSLPYSTTQKVNSIWDINENWLRGIFNSEGVQVYR